MWTFLFVLAMPLYVMAQEPLLVQAEAITALYGVETAKDPSPSAFPLTEKALDTASTWLSIDLTHFITEEGTSPLEILAREESWQQFKTLGMQAVHFFPLRKEGSLGLDSSQKSFWPSLTQLSQKMQIALLGDLIGNASSLGVDFLKAIQNEPAYRNLYTLIEIDPKDWSLLPTVPAGSLETNVPWLQIQDLHRSGYVPKDFDPYVKESRWNATDKILGVDGKLRRWIYLKEGSNRPVFAWLSPTQAANRIAFGDALYAVKGLSQKMIALDGKLPWIAQENLSFWLRKIGAFSIASNNGTIQSMQKAPSDLILDTATRAALLHAVLTHDASALKMIYELILLSGIDARKLVHVLQPMDEYACDFFELIHSPKKKFSYAQEQMTGEILRKRLLKEDLLQLQSKDVTPSTWVDHCARALNTQDFVKDQDVIKEAHLLLAFTYAMQAGAFSISASDLLGALPKAPLNTNLFTSSPSNLYLSLPEQLQNTRSFASRLKAICEIRNAYRIGKAELISVLPSRHPGTLLLLHRLPESRFLYLLAVNFGKIANTELLEMPSIANTTAIDLMTQLAQEKVFSSAAFSFILPPMTGRAFFFQPKYYD